MDVTFFTILIITSIFLRLYEKYIDPISETFAWVLMGNHFHFLVRIKEEVEIKHQNVNPNRVLNPLGVKKQKPLHSHFSDLFNAYAQAINKSIGRTGSLFEHPFRRKLVNSEEYFRNLVVYIHQNPLNHGFTDNFKDYPWSSFGTIISDKPTHINRDKVIDWFDGSDNFIKVHEYEIDFSDSEWLIE